MRLTPGESPQDKQRAGKMMVAIEAVVADAQMKGLGKGHGGQSTCPCKVCNGTVAYSVDTITGHMTAQCGTVNCLAFTK
jgi:hypothetical protein